MSKETLTSKKLTEGMSNAGNVIGAVNDIIDEVEELKSNPGVGPSPGPSDASGIDLVSTAAEEAEATDTDKVYFFSNGPLQGKGLYSTLLQNGSLTGKDGIVYHYDPRKFYHLYPDGSFDEIMPAAGDVTFQDNVVYYKGRRMPMQRYGELIYNHDILYASTSDTAVLVFRVSAPFYEDKTRVTLRYDDTYIDVYELVDNNGTKTETARADGAYFDFTNANPTQYHILLIKRNSTGYSNGYDTFLNIAVRLSTPYEDTDIHVKFPKAEVFFRADTNVTTLAAVNQNRPQDINAWNSDYFEVNPDNGRLVMKQVSLITMRQVIKEMTLDQTKRQVFYGSIFGNDISGLNKIRLEATWANWNGCSTSSKTDFPREERIYWTSPETPDSSVFGDRIYLKTIMQEFNHNFSHKFFKDGSDIFVDTADNVDEITVTLRMRKWNNSTKKEFGEIGVIFYDDNFLDFTDEIPVPSNS